MIVLVDDVRRLLFYTNVLVITIFYLDWQCNYGEQHFDRILAITSSSCNVLLCTMRMMLSHLVLLLFLLIVYLTTFFFNYFFIFILHYLFRNNNNNKCVLFCFVPFHFTSLLVYVVRRRQRKYSSLLRYFSLCVWFSFYVLPILSNYNSFLLLHKLNFGSFRP